MKPQITFQILDTAASRRIPATLNLAPKILTKIRSEKRSMLRPGMKLASAVLIVILAMLLITGIVYAIYRLTSGDPGLQSVQESGLEKHLNETAQPTLLPTSTAVFTPQAPIPLGLSQTHSGVTLTLDSIFIDEAHLGLGMHFSPVPPGLELGAPAIRFVNATPLQARGWTERLNQGAGQAEYISYQVIQSEAVNGKVKLSVDVPLLQTGDGKATALDNFHFELTDIPVARVQGGIPLQQTYGVRVNGLEVRLESVQVTEFSSEARLCFDSAASDVKSASIELDGGPKTAFSTSAPQDSLAGGPCVRLTFPAGSPASGKQVILHVDELSAAQNKDEKLSGPWDFYVDLPNYSASTSQVTPTVAPASPSLGAQTMGTVTVTLDWVFVDARRAAVGYTVRGLPEQPEATSLSGNIQLKNSQGETLGGAGIGSDSIERVEGQPGVLQGTWSVGFDKPLTQAEATFTLDITLDGTHTNDSLGNFPIPPEATPYPPGVFPPALPDHLVGTYHFEFNAPVYPMQILQNLPPVTANGVEITIPRIEMTASLTEVMLCYNKPSAGDWWVMAATLKNASASTDTIRSGKLLYDNPNLTQPKNPDQNLEWPIPQAIKSAQNGRCMTINFLLGHANRSGTVTLTIPQIEVSPPEFIPDDQMQAARARLKAEGIEMDYTTTSSGGGGGGGPRFTQLPQGMDEQQAYQRFMEALGYVHSGPWVFTFDVSP